jgi:hypothetical protein
MTLNDLISFSIFTYSLKPRIKCSNTMKTVVYTVYASSYKPCPTFTGSPFQKKFSFFTFAIAKKLSNSSSFTVLYVVTGRLFMI